jgi:ABC-2 type transport system permease protein
MALTSALTLALEALLGTLAFWLEDIGSVMRGNAVLATVLGGQLVPLALMPAWSHVFLVAQPYRSMVSFPLEIISGDLNGQEMAIGFGLQVLWIAVITWGAFALWRRGLKEYTVFNL